MDDRVSDKTFLVAFTVPVDKWTNGGLDFQSLFEWTEKHTAEGRFEMASGDTDAAQHHIALKFRTEEAAKKLADHLKTFGYVKINPLSLAAAPQQHLRS